MITVFVNGEQKNFAQPVTLQEVLEILQLKGQRMAVEVNGEVVPKSCYGTYTLKDGDCLEVVVAVGGG
jgi:sulfur carrier protein